MVSKLNKNFWHGYYSSFYGIRDSILAELKEFKNITVVEKNNIFFDLDFRTIKHALMKSVILGMSQLIGELRNDQTNLNYLKIKINFPGY